MIYTDSVRPISAAGRIFSLPLALIRKLRQLLRRGFGSEEADHNHGCDGYKERWENGIVRS
jgi:hypothetical protein